MALDSIRNAVIIFNPAAGRLRRGGSNGLPEAVRILAQAGIEAALRPTDAPGSATRLAHDAVQHGSHLVIACGGDGTLHEVVNGLAVSRVPLALLPAGTANVLAKELKLSWNLASAAKQIVRGRLQRIALGQALPENPSAEPHYFIALAGAGVDADMVHRVSPALKKRYGKGAYWVAGIEEFLTYSYPMFRADSKEEQRLGSYVAIGRTKAHGFPVSITDRANLFGDDFEVALFTNRSNWRSFLHGWAAILGRLRSTRDIHFWRTREIRCTPENNEQVIHVQADGELIGTLPMTFRVIPDALTLVIPS